MRATPLIFIGPLLALSAACVDLDVANPNEPDGARALSVPADVEAAAVAAVHTWYMGVTHYYPNIMTMVTADHLTGSFCLGMRFNNVEPRIPYNNSVGCDGSPVAERPWESLYDALIMANEALAALDRGVAFENDPDATEATRAAALFAQAGSLTYLGLLFDQAFAITTPPDPPNLATLRDHGAVLDSALAAWDRLIALTDGKAWSWDAAVIPLDVGPATAAHVNRIARTMAARTLVYAARNPTENAATDWNAVLAYADGAMTGTGVTDMDFSVIDDYDTWWDYTKNYGGFHSWLRVDQRVIHRMASNIPERFTGLANQALPTPEDDRLDLANLPCVANDPLPCTAGISADFVYVGTLIGDPGRGVYMQSPFWHRRYDSSSFSMPASVNIGRPLPHILAAENDLIIAEALARTGGDLTRAAALVNKTHVGRGGRTPVAATAPAVLAGVDYERDVELLATSGMLSLWGPATAERQHVQPWDGSTSAGPRTRAGGAGTAGVYVRRRRPAGYVSP